jgi:Asp-tRNA(Asn)/Glu-tRNA(Gln) amidotransferase A subunit family amidase
MAATFATLAVGTDTSVSVQSPSSNCSVVGLVGTYGMVSRAGIVPRGATQDRPGPMGRSVYDVATLYSVISGWDAEDFTTFSPMGHFPQDDWAQHLKTATLKGKRLGVLREMIPAGAEFDEPRAIFEKAIADLRAAGAYIVDPLLTGNPQIATDTGQGRGRTAEYEKFAFTDAYLARLGSAAPFKNTAEMIAKVGKDKFGASMLTAAALPPPDKSPDYLARYASRRVYIDLIAELQTRYKLDGFVQPFTLVVPVRDSARPASAGGERRGGSYGDRPGVNNLTSTTGLPAVVVPGGYTPSKNFPIAIQFLGREHSDLEIIKLAHAYEHRHEAPQKSRHHARAARRVLHLRAPHLCKHSLNFSRVASLLFATLARGATFDLQTATLADINAAMDAGALSSEKLVGLYLARIAAYDQAGPRINSVITLNAKALETARALDAERKAKGPRSPLHGVPVVLKDLFDTKDLPTSGGFLPLKASQPLYDATVVARLRAAGAIILAKVNMSDWFGTPPRGDQSTVLGRTSNPYNLALTPGGSSGGTGASLAAAFAHLGLGSETGVSIRNPTANNSVVGLAPTRGLIPRTGQIMTSFTQERCGPMARSVYDVAAMTSVVAGFDAEDLLTISSPGMTPKQPYTAFLDKAGLRGARIGVFRDLFRKGPKFTPRASRSSRRPSRR